MGVVVAEIAAQVELVMRRAAELFAAPDTDEVGDGGDLGSALTHAASVTESAGQLGGQTGAAVHGQVSDTVTALSQLAAEDEALIRRLTALATAHGRATADAHQLITQTRDTVVEAAQLDGVPAGEVAVLRQLRALVQRMQILVDGERRRAEQALDGDADSPALDA